MTRNVFVVCALCFLAACSQAPAPEAVAVQSPEARKTAHIQALRDALKGQFKIIDDSRPLYLGELRGILEDLVRLGESDVELRLNLAQVLVFEKRFDKALEILKTLSQEVNQSVVVQSYGEALIAADRRQEAEDLFIADHRANPERLESLGQAAALAWIRGDAAQAFELASKVLLERPLDANALEVVVRHALANGEEGIAGLLFERAQAANVHTPELAWLSGQREEKRGELARALRIYREGVARFPKAQKLREAVAGTALSLSDGMVAHEAYTWLLNQQPQQAAWSLGLAVSARLQGQFDEAARLYVQVLKQTPDAKEVLWNDGLLAQVYQGDYERAYERLSHLKKVLGESQADDYQGLGSRLTELDELVQEERALAAEEEAERQAQLQIQAVCEALARSKQPDFSRLQSKEILVDAGWDLLAQAVAQWEEAPGQAMEQVTCAFTLAGKAEGFREENCAAMHHSWARRMDQVGDRVEAMRHLKVALDCDPEHKNARLLMEKVSAQ